ncbi:MAG: hypothetical protein HRT72_00250 [Flavobacteriales bacterium]|nr:hypothetical protein [Flavobacteriales bacterium]
MIKAKLYIVLASAFLMLVGINVDSQAQCKSFTKKKCVPQLAPYIHNGQFNSAVIAAGETVEIGMVFYKGQDYRVLVGTQEVLGEVVFMLIDGDGKELYSNGGGDDNFDFNVDATQRLTIRIVAPKSETTTGILPSGCISLLIGFKD